MDHASDGPALEFTIERAGTKYRWRLRTPAGEVLATSRLFDAKADALSAVFLVQTSTIDSDVFDWTDRLQRL